jgi:hypothetical protein
MSDYVNSRPAKVGEKLRTHRFHPGIIGFAASGNPDIAVRILPGTELAFATAIKCSPRGFGLFGWKLLVVNHTTATFRKSINTICERMMKRWNSLTGRWPR